MLGAGRPLVHEPSPPMGTTATSPTTRMPCTWPALRDRWPARQRWRPRPRARRRPQWPALLRQRPRRPHRPGPDRRLRDDGRIDVSEITPVTYHPDRRTFTAEAAPCSDTTTAFSASDGASPCPVVSARRSVWGVIWPTAATAHSRVGTVWRPTISGGRGGGHRPVRPGPAWSRSPETPPEPSTSCSGPTPLRQVTTCVVDGFGVVWVFCSLLVLVSGELVNGSVCGFWEGCGSSWGCGRGWSIGVGREFRSISCFEFWEEV